MNLFLKKRPLLPLLLLRLQDDHLCLTASQGSFPENSFLAVYVGTNIRLGRRLYCEEGIEAMKKKKKKKKTLDVNIQVTQ